MMRRAPENEAPKPAPAMTLPAKNSGSRPVIIENRVRAVPVMVKEPPRITADRAGAKPKPKPASAPVPERDRIARPVTRPLPELKTRGRIEGTSPR